jgi:hypothetical protein
LILVDSSVWIDYFRGARTRQSGRLHALLGTEPLAIGDLVLAEVLQGFDSDREFRAAKSALSSLELIELGGLDIAIQSARNYRYLRSIGVTVRKTLDCIIATRCIEDGLSLLHDDRDFDPFARHLGLRVVS